MPSHRRRKVLKKCPEKAQKKKEKKLPNPLSDYIKLYNQKKLSALSHKLSSREGDRALVDYAKTLSSLEKRLFLFESCSLPPAIGNEQAPAPKVWPFPGVILSPEKGKPAYAFQLWISRSLMQERPAEEVQSDWEEDPTAGYDTIPKGLLKR